MNSQGKVLLWYIAHEFDLFLVLRENERDIELNSSNGLGVRGLSLKLESLPTANGGISSKSLRPRLLTLCDRGLVFFERGSGGANSQQVNLYRLPPVVVEYLDACEEFLKKVEGEIK